MSWLARSIANTLRLDEDDGEEEDEEEYNISLPEDTIDNRTGKPNSSDSVNRDEGDANYEEVNLDDQYDNEIADHCNDGNQHGRGMKEDLSELRETLKRQLWGVASFLAPQAPPPPPPPPPRRPTLLDREQTEFLNRFSSGGESEEEEAEDVIGDSGNLDYGLEDRIGDAVGMTEEVLAFALNIAHHPETWLDFPLEEEEFEELDISEAQYKHTLAIECLAPRLAALRIELCPAHMSAGYFWMVYFVLLHSRLNKHDAELLSTPQLAKARAMWMHELQKRTKAESDWFGRDEFHPKESTVLSHEEFNPTSSEDAQSSYVSHRTFSFEPITHYEKTEAETEEHLTEGADVQFIGSSTFEEDLASKPKKESATSPSYKEQVDDFDDDGDGWLDEDSELDGFSVGAIGNGEDVSFSDLEDDTDCTIPIKSRLVAKDWGTPEDTL